MKSLHFLALCLALCFTSTSFGRSEAVQIQAVVQIGGCSGVIVSPEGHVMTARHCDCNETETVLLRDGHAIKAKRVYAWNRTKGDGPDVYDLEGSGYTFCPVSETKPKKGDKVHSWGYPSIDGKRVFRYAEGTLLGGGYFELEDHSSRNGITKSLGSNYGNIATLKGSPGWSGGPLYNAAGEVVGLCTGGGDGDSIWTSFASTQEAYQIVIKKRPAPAPGPGTIAQPQPNNRPVLYIFTDPSWCLPCNQFEKAYRTNIDFRKALDAAFRVEFKKPDIDLALARQFGVTSIPAFVPMNAPPVNGKPFVITGYDLINGDKKLLAQLAPYMKRPDPNENWQPIPQPVPQPVPSPVEESDPPPAPEPPKEPVVIDPEWSHVRVILLLKEQDASKLGDSVAGLLLKYGIGTLERHVAEISEGKAMLQVVAERATPMQYDGIREAAGIDIDHGYFVLLVKRQPIGLVKGVIAKKFEKQLPEKLKAFPVEVITERLHPKYFSKVESIANVLAEADPTPPEAGQVSEKTRLKKIVEGLLLPAIESQFARARVKDASEKEEEEKKSKGKHPWKEYFTLSGLAALLMERLTSRLRQMLVQFWRGRNVDQPLYPKKDAK